MMFNGFGLNRCQCVQQCITTFSDSPRMLPNFILSFNTFHELNFATLFSLTVMLNLRMILFTKRFIDSHTFDRQCFKKLGLSWPLFLYLSIFNKALLVQLIANKFVNDRGSLVSEVTALPTAPQPLPKLYISSNRHCIGNPSCLYLHIAQRIASQFLQCKEQKIFDQLC